ncbi:MAG: transposase [Deltaproteobacteria bacterium]|nr:transposase [Deltaproteobacteria bacterium]
MFHVRDRRTGSLFDPWAYLGPKRRKLLDRSWAGLFRKEILPHLPVEAITAAFHARLGRPSKDAYTLMGALVFQAMHDTNDEETVRQLAFNTEWQYALDLSDESDEGKYVCLRTLWTMRQLLAEKKLDRLLFDSVTKKLASVFSVDTSKQRLDSVHITSNMRRLGRIGIFVRVITGFLTNLKRREPELFATLDPSFGDRYLSPKGQAVFSMVRPSESDRTLSRVTEDLFVLFRRFEKEEAVALMKTYSLLSRVFSEQCNVVTEKGRETVVAKPPKEISSGSLQNPSDPEAGYSGHKGQGYQAQVMETYVPMARAEEGAPANGDAVPLRLITHVEVEPANISDAHALLPAIEGATRLGLAPIEVLADSLYGSDKNVVAAAEAGVEVVSPVMGQTDESEVTMADFSFSDDSAIVACPQGHAPIIFRRKGKRRTVVFANGDCLGCPKKKECPIKPVRDGYGFHYTEPALRLARRRAAQKTEAFKDRYRHRSGVESTMSAFDRLTGVKHLRVRGMKAVRFAVTLKALGVNLIRAAAVWMAGTSRNLGGNGAPGREKGTFREANSELVCLHAAFESILVECTNRFIRFNTRSLHEDDFVLQQAA